MATSPLHLPVLARQAEDENWQFRQFLKTRCRLDSDELDQRVFEITHQVWAGIDCTTCANCCRTVHPTFNDEDVARLSARLGVTREQFIETYLQPADSDGENPWQTRTTPCPFLKDNRCTIYEDRPADCRGYPYLYEPGFVFRIMAMIERTHTCPIVYEVMEALKPATGFRPGRR